MSVNYAAARAICLSQLGRMDEARILVGPLLEGVAGSDEEFPMAQLILLLQAAVVLEHKAAAKALVARLACVAHLIGDFHVCTCIARHLGDAAALEGDRAEARAYYLQAVDSAAKIRFRPELALTHLRLAELPFEEADEAARLEALAHLDLAIPELRDMNMRPALERARVLHESLVPTGGLAPARELASASPSGGAW
jgi:hypothetical protein